MPLPQFEFVNEGPIEKVECPEVPNLMIIAGPNGVGKTTLLDNIAESIEDGTFSTGPVGKTNAAFVGPHRGLQGEIELQEQQLIGTPSHSSNYLYSKSASDATNLRDFLDSSAGRGIPRRPYNDRNRTESDELPYFEVQRRLAQINHDLRDYSWERIKEEGEFNDEELLNWTSTLSDAIDQVLPGIELEGIEKTEEYKYVLKFQNRDGSVVRFHELSSGEKDAVALLFLLIEDDIEKEFRKTDVIERSDEDLVILYDSPEAYLHPQLQLNFINYIKDNVQKKKGPERSVQVIIATHSKMIIDNVPDQSLYYLFFADQIEGNQLKPASDLPDELRQLITEEIGLTALSSGEDLLLVEGSSDREVFHRIDTGIEAGLSVIPIGGKEPIMNLDEAFNILIPKLEQSGVNLYAIVDRDRDLDLDRDVSNNIHTLPATSVENLVLQPEAIFRTVQEILGEDLDEERYDRPEDIEQLLQNIVSDEGFVEWEAQLRWNEQFNPFNISYSSFQASEGFPDIETFAKNEVENQLNDIEGFSDIRDDVKQMAENGEFNELHGKKILAEISNEFNIPTDRLLRMSAKRIELGDLPKETQTFLKNAKPT
jgi:energy-coupling factor transporter ATP-binding protein EcfA2